MSEPMGLIRLMSQEGLKCDDVVTHWSQDASYLVRLRLAYKGRRGDIVCYSNPPVHQVGNPGLDAYLEAMEDVNRDRNALDFLILFGTADPVHAGGDLKETLGRLDATMARRKELEAAGAPAADIDPLYAWGDARLDKGLALYRGIRKAAEALRVVAVCSGGTRYGGSAEIALMGDVILGDSRSAMCFSEVQIGLIPGWGGIGRCLTRAGWSNARTLALTAREVSAVDLLAVGIYNEVAEFSDPLPRPRKTGDAAKDRRDYQEALREHNDGTAARMLPRALELAVTDKAALPGVKPEERRRLRSDEETTQEVLRRKNPYEYAHLWGKSLKEAARELEALGRPLAPQSVEAIETLLEEVRDAPWDEDGFVEREMRADAALYRDPRLRSGIVATLEQKVADFREV